MKSSDKIPILPIGSAFACRFNCFDTIFIELKRLIILNVVMYFGFPSISQVVDCLRQNFDAFVHATSGIIDSGKPNYREEARPI